MYVAQRKEHYKQRHSVFETAKAQLTEQHDSTVVFDAHLIIAWHADSSRRAFYKEFVKVVDAADVVIEVLDARDPLGCRCLDVERLVRKSGADKKVILLLNKIGKSPVFSGDVRSGWGCTPQSVMIIVTSCCLASLSMHLGLQVLVAMSRMLLTLCRFGMGCQSEHISGFTKCCTCADCFLPNS